MDKLLFPRFAYNTIIRDEKVYIRCLLRKKYVRLTPEEWVRQHVINHLVTDLNYPAGRMRAEGKINKRTGTWQRADILLYDNAKKVHMIVECKSVREKLSASTVQQMLRYNEAQVPLLVFTNGIVLFCFSRCHAQPRYVRHPKIPIHCDA